ncbi:MAG: dihydroorotase, partial [Jatrophihabitantaceae bacterium]
MSPQSMSGPVLLQAVAPLGGRPVDVLLVNGLIAEIGASIEAPAGCLVVPAEGAVLLPGLVDLHTHLREPGR